MKRRFSHYRWVTLISFAVMYNFVYLGLYISSQIISQHSGRMSAKEKKGRAVRLPNIRFLNRFRLRVILQKEYPRMLPITQAISVMITGKVI